MPFQTGKPLERKWSYRARSGPLRSFWTRPRRAKRSEAALAAALISVFEGRPAGFLDLSVDLVREAMNFCFTLSG